MITENLDQVDAVVALIGPTWVGRLDSPTDFVRMEIAHALGAGKPVIPVLIEDTPLPEVAALPEDLQSLLEINAVRVRRDPDLATRPEQRHWESAGCSERQAHPAPEGGGRGSREAEEKESQAKEAALRRQLQEELVRLKRRRPTDATRPRPSSRSDSPGWSSWLVWEEATRRQIADERIQLAAPRKPRNDATKKWSPPRLVELANPEGTAPLPGRREVIGRPRHQRPSADSAPGPAPRAGDRRLAPSKPQTALGHGAAAYRRRFRLIGATAVGIAALPITVNTGHRAGCSDWTSARLLTLSLLAPLCPQRPRCARSLLASRLLPGVSALTSIGSGVHGARCSTATERDDRAPLLLSPDARPARPSDPGARGGHGARIAPAVGISGAPCGSSGPLEDLLHGDEHHTDIYVSPNAQLPRLAILLAVPVVLLVVWTLRRTRTAAVAVVTLASVASVAYFTAAYDWGTAPVHVRGEFIFAAVAAVAIAAIGVHSLVSPESSA